MKRSFETITQELSKLPADAHTRRAELEAELAEVIHEPGPQVPQTRPAAGEPGGVRPEFGSLRRPAGAGTMDVTTEQ